MATLTALASRLPPSALERLQHGTAITTLNHNFLISLTHAGATRSRRYHRKFRAEYYNVFHHANLDADIGNVDISSDQHGVPHGPPPGPARAEVHRRTVARTSDAAERRRC